MLIPLLLLALQIPHFSFGPDIDLRPLSKEFPGRPQLKAYVPGKTAVTIYSGQPEQTPGYYALGSDRVDPEGFCREGELVFVSKWVGRKGYFRDELWSKFDGQVKMVRVDDLVTKDVRLDGGTGTLHFALVDGAEIENWTVPAGWDRARAVSVQFSRNIILRSIKVGPSLQTGPGQGYAVQSQRSVNVNCSGLWVDGVRHAFNVFSGANVFCGGVWGTNMAGAIVETHGYGARRVGFVGIHGKANIAVGNRAKWGDEVEIWEADCEMLWLHGPSRVKVYDSRFSGPLGLERNQFGEPISLEATRCTFTAYSTTKAIHMASADLVVVPVLNLCKLVEWVAGL